jgi:hypothetical protein
VTRCPPLSASDILSLSVVRQEFPMMSRLLNAGLDAAALGAPRATRRSQFSDPFAMARPTVALGREYQSE